jgi:hypothetical protein
VDITDSEITKHKKMVTAAQEEFDMAVTYLAPSSRSGFYTPIPFCPPPPPHRSASARGTFTGSGVVLTGSVGTIVSFRRPN